MAKYKFKEIKNTNWFIEAEQKYLTALIKKEYICPICLRKLVKKYEGWACVNNCNLNFKCGIGWVYLDGKKKNSFQFHADKYDFNIESFKNKKKWLILKLLILNERNRKCEVCGDDLELEVHHIIPRSEEPSLTFDKENLMVLCKNCHNEIHKEDKYNFSKLKQVNNGETED